MAGAISDAKSGLDTALKCFELVQIARSFDDDFNSHRIKLDIIQLRLSRWGEAVGLDSSSTALATKGSDEGATNINQSTTIKTSLLTGEKDEAARELLQAIVDQFDVAKKKAAGVKSQQKVTDCIDPANDLSSPIRTLHTKLRAALGRRRAQLVKAKYSAEWALYKKEQFDKLVADITENIDQLEALFAADGNEADEATKKRLYELSVSDCAGIIKVYLEELSTVTKECDPYLDAAVAKALERREAARSDTSISMRNDGYNYGQQIGQMTGNQTHTIFGQTNNNYDDKRTPNHQGGGGN